MADDVEAAGFVFLDGAACADEARFHAACSLLRVRDPIHLVQADGFAPFWAITKHRDIVTIESHPTVFLAGPRPTLNPEGEGLKGGRVLVSTDGAEHRKLRDLTSNWFHPKALSRLELLLSDLARQLVDDLADRGGACDFVSTVSGPMALAVISRILGLSPRGERVLHRLDELFACEESGEVNDETTDEDFDLYFSQLVEARREHPADDLSSTIANGIIDDIPLTMLDAISYFILMGTAGHGTVAAAIAGGLEALIRNPDSLSQLQNDPGLIPSAVEEMIRWVSPVRHFMRTATEAFEVGGRTVAPGESVLLSYPSANRDEDVFVDPFAFNISRNPNRHIAFGVGPHYCLGVHLARMEMRTLFTELIPRIRSIEIEREPARKKSMLLAGLTSLSIRYEIIGRRS
jgi:cytochrome P450